jgi:serine/threonine-protein kinase
VTEVDRERDGEREAATRLIEELGLEDLASTAVVLEERGVSPLDATLPGAPPRSAKRLLAVTPLPELDLGADRELQPGEPIGEGGMGEVRLAIQRSLGREVALKELRDTLVEDAGAAWLLVDEARITGALEHPNIVPIHALGVDADGLPVMVMKRLTGRSWRDVMHEEADAQGQTLRAAGGDLFGANLETLMQVCNAVHFAHSKGVVHRDIKPENVMIGDHGEVYLLDWGAALSYRAIDPSEAVVGTLAYMAPEMLRGSSPEITPRTDVYLLGATLHEILTGRAPHAADDVQAAVFSICKSEVAELPAWVPGELADLCRRALSRDPAERPESALAFRMAVADYMTHRGSIEIARAATRRLTELAALCQPASAPDAEEHAHVDQLFIECAFGYRQALQAWEQNPEARAGLQEAHEHMIQFALANRDAKAATKLLAQLSEPREDLRLAVEELERELAEEGEELERLRHIAKEQDASVASSARATSAVVTGVCLAALFAWLSQRFPGAAGLSHRTITVVTLVIMAALAAGVFVSREKVLANDVNRHLTSTMFAIVLTVIGIHVAGMLTDAPVAYAFIADFFVSGAVSASVGYNVHRGMIGVGLVYVVGALAASFAPQLVLEVMAATFLLAHLTLAWVWRALARETASQAG